MTTKKWSMSNVFHLGWINVKVLSWLRLAETAFKSLVKLLTDQMGCDPTPSIFSIFKGSVTLHHYVQNRGNIKCCEKLFSVLSQDDSMHLYRPWLRPLVQWYLLCIRLHWNDCLWDWGKQLYKIKSSEIELVKQLRVHRPPK